MPPLFQIVVTPGFERSVRRLARTHRQLPNLLEELISVLKDDPHNRSQTYPIKKLTGVKTGEGQWRIWSGDFRLRYDISNQDVILHTIRLRRDAY